MLLCIKCGKDKCDDFHLLCKDCESIIILPTKEEKKQIISALEKYQKKLSRQGEWSFYTDELLRGLQSGDERKEIFNTFCAREFMATFEITPTDLDKATEEF